MFLRKLIDNNFYAGNTTFTIKQIANDSGFRTDKVTKWISEIYNDIFALNLEEPGLFKGEGIYYDLYIKYYDNAASIKVWLPQSPKIMEMFIFPFVKARIGTDRFFVKDVEHMVNDGEYTVTLWLSGHERNVYREWLVDRALYTGVLHFIDMFDKHPFEIDKTLLDWYKK